jgi:hypothetical protein
VTKVARVVGITHKAKPAAKAAPAKHAVSRPTSSANRAAPASVVRNYAAAPAAAPSQDQYKPGKGCGDKNHVHERENECKDK